MAGDWIKMRMDLPEDPAVIGIANKTGLDEDTVVGKLFRIWCWANRQTIDGNATSVTETWLDRYVNMTGFAKAMVEVGWLCTTAGGIALPDFDKHNSETAKQRALTAIRARRYRHATSVTKSARKAHLEKRREEKSKEEVPNGTSSDVPPEPSPTTIKSPFSFPVKGGKLWDLPQRKLDEYLATHAEHIEVAYELAKARDWLMKHPARRKTAGGMLRFLTGWLNRASDDTPAKDSRGRKIRDFDDLKLGAERDD